MTNDERSRISYAIDKFQHAVFDLEPDGLSDSFKSAARNLFDYLNGKAIQVSWSIDDVLEKGKDRNLTEGEAKKVLANMKKNHDANVGIDWVVIDTHIDMVIEERKS